MDIHDVFAPPRLVRFTEIAERLPPTCWAVWRNTVNAGEFADEPVLWVPGPLSAGTIDLARWPAPGLDSTQALIVVVDGDLCVDTLYNWDADGCTGLVVLGHLEVGHAVVGGQEIFVTGNLTVRELFWGDYNHGALQVEGRIHARVLLTTGEYHIESRAQHDGDLVELFLEERADVDREHADVAAQYFLESVINRREPDPEGLGDVVPRYRVVEALLRGEPVLKTPFEPIRPVQVPRLFGEVALSDAASMVRQEALFQALIEQVPEDAPEQQFRCAACAADVFVTRAHRRVSDQVAVPDVMVILGDDGLEVRLWRDEPGVLGRMTGRTTGLTAVFKHLGTGVYGFRPVWSDPQVVATIEAVWNDALRRLEADRFWRARLQEQVKAPQLLALLDLPIVAERYNDWSDPDRNGFWDGHLSYTFHRPSDTEPWAILRISVERQDTDDADIRSYQFEVDDVASPGPVSIRYKSSQQDRPLGSPADPYCKGPRALSVFDGQQIEEALRWYARCARRLPTCVPEDDAAGQEECDDSPASLP
jgi:hypothetical protein